jgi:hypothetical protein
MSNLPFWPHSGVEALSFAQTDRFALSSKRLLNNLQSEMALKDALGDRKREVQKTGEERY